MTAATSQFDGECVRHAVYTAGRFERPWLADALAARCNLSTASEVGRHFGKGCTACLPELF